MADLPNVWGRGGAIFAFSGVDGPTDWRHPLVGSTLPNGRGILFHTPTAVSVVCGRPDRDTPVEPEIVAGDVISLVIGKTGAKVRLRYVFLDNNTVVGELRTMEGQTPTPVSVELLSETGAVRAYGRAVELRGLDEEFTLLGEKSHCIAFERGLHAHLAGGQCLRFALGYSAQEPYGLALERALAGISVGSIELFRKKLAFFEQLPALKTDDPLLRRTFYKCASIQKVNCCTAEGDIPFNWTTPDRWPHRHMWIWDSAFHALGLRHFAPDWARDAIKAVLAKQRPDGFIPHMMTSVDAEDSKITQPPILSWAAWKVYEKAGDDGFLRYCYPHLKAMVLYDCEKLDRDASGLSEWESGGASGMDNSPRFDQPLGDAVDLNSFLSNDMSYLEMIARTLALHDEAAMWAGMRSKYAQRINERMWDGATGFYYDLTPDGGHLKLKTEAGFVPLFAGICTDDQAAALVSRLTNPGEFWRPFPVASVSADEPSFSDDMWRGPTWINYNYMIIQGLLRYGYLDLAKDLRERTLREIARRYAEDGVIYEFYDSEAVRSPSELGRKGKKGVRLGDSWVGHCIRDYHWTAALYVDLMLGSLEDIA